MRTIALELRIGKITSIGGLKMAMTNINIRTDSELKGEAQAVLSDLGLDMTTAINIFLRQVVYKESIPFSIDRAQSTPTKIERKAMRGRLNGKVWMADDFDAPLTDMREYM